MADTQDNSQDALRALLNTAQKGRHNDRWPWLVAGATVAMPVAGTTLFPDSGTREYFITAEANIGTLVVTASASETVQPTSIRRCRQQTLQHRRPRASGGERHGQEGALLAQLDTTKLTDAMARSQVAVASTKARVA